VVTAGSGFLLENPFGSQCGADVDQSSDSQELQLWGYGSTSRIAIAACTYEKRKITEFIFKIIYSTDQ